MKLPSIYEGSFLANLRSSHKDSPRQSPRLPGPHASSSIFYSESRSPFPSTIHKRSRSNNPAILQALDRKLANITPIQPTIDPSSARGYGPPVAQYYQGYSSPNLSPNIRPVNHHSRRNHSHETIKIVPGQYPMNSYPVPLMSYVPHPMPIKIPVIPASNLLYGHNSPSSYSSPNHDSHEMLIKLVEKQNNLIERMAHRVDSQYEKMFKSEKKSLNKKLEKLKLEKLMDQRIAQNANSMSSLSNLMLFKDKKTTNSSNDLGSGRIPSIARLLDD